MKILALIFASVLLSGCFHATMPTKTDVVDIQYIHPAPPAEMTLREVKWRVFNKEELEKYIEENEGIEFALFALETEEYEDLALNMQEIIRYIQEQKGIIIYYRETLPDPEKEEDENSEDD